jgi:flagellar biosynthesis/type III secretory pathway M-ring protein FliF/YscJ
MKSKVIDGNPNQGNVLPKSVRRFETAWTKGNTNYGDEVEMMPMGFWEKVSYEWKNFAFGKYTATLTLTYTSKKLVDSATTSFYVFPWHLLLVVLAVLVVIWFIFRKILMAYNRMLIAQVREKIEEEIEEKLEKKQEDHQSTKKHTRPRV